MAAAKTNLTLAVSGAHSPKKRTTRLMNPYSNLLKSLGPAWKNMDGQTKSGWLALARNLASTTEPGVKVRISAYNTFTDIASVQFGAGMSVPVTAPADHTRPDPLPGLILTMTGAGPTLSLSLSGVTPYTDKVQVFAARPLLLGQNVYSKLAYKLLGTVNSLATPADITALYKSLYNVQSFGYQIALKCYGLNADGLRSGPVLVSGENPAPPAPALSLE